MTPEEQERKLGFEQEIQKMAIAEYYAYVDQHNRTRKEKDARMFYDAMRLGIKRGMNFMAHQYELQKQQEKKDETTS
jgi:hypothetical protein